jgi:hypothetical protein
MLTGNNRVCIASVVRMVYIWDPKAPQTVAISEVMIISSIQLGVAVLCACLPTYGPLLNASRRGLRRAKRAMNMSVRNTTTGGGTLTPKNPTSNRSDYYRMGDMGGTAEARSGSAEGLVELGEVPQRSIMVQKSIHVS